MSRPRIALITSDERRHRYVATRIAADLGLAGILAEAKSNVPKVTAAATSPKDVHLGERDAAEQKILGETEFPDVAILRVARGEARNDEAGQFIANCRADAIILYGCGIAGEEILGRHPHRVINMHLGLSPYYRGSGTNFWPLAEGHPEGVGTTIHLAVAKVDAGPILRQIRPIPDTTDRAHDLGAKAIIAGADALVSAVPAYLAGKIEPSVQDLSKGRVYRKRDFDDAAVERLWRNLEDGMMARYISEKASRDGAMPIVE